MDAAFDDTPELAATNFHGVAGSQPAGLEVPAELMEDGLLEVSKDADSAEEVVEVRVQRIGGAVRGIGEDRVDDRQAVREAWWRGWWQPGLRVREISRSGASGQTYASSLSWVYRVRYYRSASTIKQRQREAETYPIADDEEDCACYDGEERREMDKPEGNSE